MNTVTPVGGQSVAPYSIVRVSLARPLVWLTRGLGDLLRAPSASLAYGLLVSLMGALILGFWRHPYLIATSITGFLLVGPLLTAGLCEMSRRIAAGEAVDFESSLSALTRHRGALMQFSAGLLATGLVWLALSFAMLELALGNSVPSVGSTIWGGALDQLSPAQLFGYMIVGGVLAVVVFARSVVSVPLIVDRDADSATATRTSIRVAREDLPTMIVWAALIVGLVAIGFATYLIGMIAIFPLLGHATWHAYRDLVG
jgi:uncharacterized membrane protein